MKQVTLQQFANEIHRDLQHLFAENPNGIPISAFMEYYGESYQRVVSAVEILAAKEICKLFKSPSSAYKVQPFGVPDVTGLSDLQQRCLNFIKGYSHDLTLTTSYPHLALNTKSSSAGVRNAVLRLNELGYIAIVKPGMRGHSNTLVLKVLPKD